MSAVVVVLSEVDARGVAWISLNRPEVNNAYNGDLIEQLAQTLETHATDSAVRLVVIRGNGRHFQAGADLQWLDQVGHADVEENLRVSRQTALAMHGLNNYPKPTLALVQGGCFGGGIGLIASCDVVLAEASARFAITEARWGLIAAIIIPQLNATMGLRQVRRYALSCEIFDAQRALQMGLVHELCESGHLQECAEGIIDQLLKSAPDALAQTKQFALHDAGLDDDGEAFEAMIVAHALKRRSEESMEGLASFREKRDANWYRSG